MTAMTLMWTQVVDWAKTIRNETEDQFRAVLIERGVTSATVTNWKGSGTLPPRPIPIARYPLFAELLRKSLDELHGKKSAAGVRESTLIYANSDHESKLLAAEISQLNKPERDMLTNMVNVLVASKKRAEQEKKKAAQVKDDKKDKKQRSKHGPRQNA
jgi:hypothetical protein